MINSVRRLFTFLIAFATSAVMPHILFGQAAGPTVYVWEFANRDGTVDETTTSLTEEFEEALIQAQCCTILQRRNYARLFEQRQNERAIMRLESIPEATINGLRTLEANAIAFGEVYNDTQGGVVRVSVNFETFESTILAKASTLMPPYDYANPFKRREKMDELLGDLPFVDGIESGLNETRTSSNSEASNPPHGAKPLQRYDVYFENGDVRFDVISANSTNDGRYSLNMRIANKTNVSLRMIPICEQGHNAPPGQVYLADELGNVSDTSVPRCNSYGKAPELSPISLEAGEDMTWRIENRVWPYGPKDALKGKVLSLNARFYTQIGALTNEVKTTSVEIEGIEVGN